MFSSDLFHYDAGHRAFSAELSDLGPGDPFTRVYPDAADLGLEVTSTRTGRTAIFVIEGRQESPEGELLAYLLKPAGALAYLWRQLPVPDRKALSGVAMILFND